MLDLSTILKYYKREDIQKAIVDAAKDKEVGIKYGDKGFGKRPDILQYPRDIIELAKQGCSSLHCSEELWTNPLLLDPNLRKEELDKLRKGWDLVLDIDCPFWGLSKIITALFVKALRDHSIKSISVKFSGNKGFHIGVPFKALPAKIDDKEKAMCFPDGPRMIAEYLLDYIDTKLVKVTEDNKIDFGGIKVLTYEELKQITGKKTDELLNRYCINCGIALRKEKDDENKQEFICPKCDSRKESNEDFLVCEKCKTRMEGPFSKSKKKSLCGCNETHSSTKFNTLSIVEVDTILIASRHLYRMPYSLHEKSKLASIPINPDSVLDFKKELAKPENVKTDKDVFLGEESIEANQAQDLVTKSIEFTQRKEHEEKMKELSQQKDIFKSEATKEFEEIQVAIAEEFFPPCVEKILKGLPDGRKRAVFILVNFMRSLGWGYGEIEQRLLEWNKKNNPPMKSGYITNHIRYHKQQNKKILPPNCSNEQYYKAIGVCCPEALCQKIKNPVNYSIIRTRYLNKPKNAVKKAEK